MTKEAENELLKAANANLQQEVVLLKEKVMELLKIIEKKGVKKDSHNSHNPPSSDKGKPKRNQSLRKKTGRKPGGQPGHKGHTLEMKSTPDKIEDLKSNYCEECGEGLTDLVHKLLIAR